MRREEQNCIISQRQQSKRFSKKKELIQGNQEIVEDVQGFKYPLKIVVSVEGDLVTVITNYPLKRGRKK